MTIGIDEQIEAVRNAWKLADMHYDPDEIIATLRRMKAIEDAGGDVPEEPYWVRNSREKVALCIHESWMPGVVKHYDTLRDLLAVTRLDADRSPCRCVPDGDDGSLAHLCKWHQDELGPALKIKRIAETGTVENFLKLPDDQKRAMFAHGIMESTARKKAEERAEAAESRCKRLEDKYAALVEAAKKICVVGDLRHLENAIVEVRGAIAALEKDPSH